MLINISIIIATHNSGVHLRKCLDSIVEQSLLPAQVLVQDAISNDDTLSILRSYEERFGGILNWRSEADSGIADAWNKAIARVTGEWVLFLGSDDVLHDANTLSYAVAALRGAYPLYRVAYGMVELFDANGSLVERIGRNWKLCATRFRDCLEFLPHQATFHHKSLFLEHGGFDTGLKIGCDYDFLLRELTYNDAHHLGVRPITRMMHGGVSTSRRNVLRVNLERILLFKRHSKRRVPIRLYWKALKALAIAIFFKIGGDGLAMRATNAYRISLRGKPPISI